MFDCPVCHITHNEPAEAVLGVHVVCMDCCVGELPEPEHLPLAA